jgi:hypothetical protein
MLLEYKIYYKSMDNIVYGGIKYRKIRHAIYCKNCKDTIESKSLHDFKYCSCGSIAIDDNRIIGDKINIENRSIYCYELNGRKIWLPNIII